MTFDLAKDGVGYSLSNPAVEPYTAKTDDYATQIMDGEHHGPRVLTARVA